MQAAGRVAQLVGGGNSFSFNTSAKSFLISYVSSEHGNEAVAYIDGIPYTARKLSCYSAISTMYYNTVWITLPNDGKEHNALVKTDDSTDENYLFKVGSITECFDK